ncbi:MAG TPA: F0F1 ATP synthase subunit B [Verrucomicrobiae bacterium]|nr:F0F1 ATP synthase subunit B [Verrucomicrobiae bacterium]
MNQLFFLASIGGDLAQTARETGERFGVEKSLFIAQVISFLIVAGLLYKFAYKPILNVLEERKQKIAESLANAEKIKAELASAQVKAQEILGQAGQQANKIIEEARTAGSREIEKASQQAIATANQIIAKAREANEAELARMKAELQREVARLVVQTSARVTGNILTSDQQSRLAEDAAKQLAA